MDAGLVWSLDELEFACEVTASGSFAGTYTTGNDWSADGVLTLQAIGSLDGVDTWGYIDITDTDSAGGTIEIVFGGSTLYSGTETSGAMVFDDVRVFTQTTGRWRFVYSAIRVYAGGVLQSTEAGGFVQGVTNGLTPAHVPLLGLPPKIFGSCGAGSASGFGAPINFTSETNVSSVVSGGWRWKYLGAASWSAPAVQLPTDLTNAASGPFGLSMTGILTSATTYGNHVSTSSRAYSTRYGATGSCPGPNTFGDAYIDGASSNGFVYLLPDLDRGYDVLEQADHAALLYRGGFPRMRYRASTSAKSFGASMPTATTADRTHLSALDEAFFLETTSEDPAIAAVMGINLITPCNVAISRNRAYSTAGGADPCDDIAVASDREDSESQGISYFYDYTHSADALSEIKVTGSGEGQVVANYLNFWGSPHWSIGHPPVSWELNTAPTDPPDYWWLVRTGFGAYGAESFNRYRRYSMMTCVLEEGTYKALLDSGYGGLRWRGTVREYVHEVEPLATYVYDSGDSSLFDSPDSSCSLTFGADIAVTVAGPTAKFRLAQSDWTAEPAGWPQIATDVLVDWTTTNVTSVRMFVVGVDGRRAFVGEDADIKGIVFALPRGGADNYAGSWAIDNGAGVLSDEGVDESGGDGISAATMADPERATSFQLLPGTGRAYIEIEVDNSGNFNFDYPELTFDPVDIPKTVCEHGSAQALIFATESV